MSDQDVTILHEAAVRDVIQDEIGNTFVPQPHIANVVDSYDFADVFDDEELELAINAQGTAINGILAALMTCGILLEEEIPEM